MNGPGSDSATRDDSGDRSFARLKKRADFQRTAKGSRFHTRAFSMQKGTQEPGSPARFGLTVTRKVGTSVERNRIRRRLREALRLGAALEAEAGHDYVIVARRELLSEPFAGLKAELTRAFGQIRRARPRGGARQPAGET
jgi:ribonuclease P protein component